MHFRTGSPENDAGLPVLQSTTKDVTTYLEEVPADWKTTLTKLRK
ncbi:MAG: hypothetical protein ACXW4U_10625 [Anaerolineales bacterium]